MNKKVIITIKKVIFPPVLYGKKKKKLDWLNYEPKDQHEKINPIISLTTPTITVKWAANTLKTWIPGKLTWIINNVDIYSKVPLDYTLLQDKTVELLHKNTVFFPNPAELLGNSLRIGVLDVKYKGYIDRYHKYSCSIVFDGDKESNGKTTKTTLFSKMYGKIR